MPSLGWGTICLAFCSMSSLPHQSVSSVALAGISLLLQFYFLMPAWIDCFPEVKQTYGLFYWLKCPLGVKKKVLQHSRCMEQVDVDHFLGINTMKKCCKNYRETANNFLFWGRLEMVDLCGGSTMHQFRTPIFSKHHWQWTGYTLSALLEDNTWRGIKIAMTFGP